MGAFNELIIERLGAEEEFIGFELGSLDVVDHDENHLELEQFSQLFLVGRGSECMQATASSS